MSNLNETQYFSTLGTAITEGQTTLTRTLLETYYHSYGITPNLKVKLRNKMPELYNVIKKYKAENDTSNISNNNGDSTPFDVWVARKMSNKYNDAVARGLEFNLSLRSMSNLMKAKKCYYSGFPLDRSTITIDRIDSSKGYVKGNVVACHTDINQFKGVLEDAQKGIDFTVAARIINKTKQHLAKTS